MPAWRLNLPATVRPPRPPSPAPPLSGAPAWPTSAPQMSYFRRVDGFSCGECDWCVLLGLVGWCLDRNEFIASEVGSRAVTTQPRYTGCGYLDLLIAHLSGRPILGPFPAANVLLPTR